MELSRDPGCLRDLLWRSDLDREPQAVIEALAGAGFEVAFRGAGLVRLRAADESEIVVVLRTGRVQLRLSYLVPPEARAEAARGLFAALLGACCRGA